MFAIDSTNRFCFYPAKIDEWYHSYFALLFDGFTYDREWHSLPVSVLDSKEFCV